MRVRYGVRRALVVPILIAACSPAAPRAVTPSPPPAVTSAPPAPAAIVTRRTIAVGDMGACAIRHDGRVLCWDVQLPPWELAPLPAAEGGAVQVAVPRKIRRRACVVSGAGNVYCNEGVHPRDPALTRVAGLDGVVDLALSDGHACAVTRAGRVRCWGENGVGQLGNGSTAKTVEPTDVGLSDAVEVWASLSTSCARGKSGEVTCWGRLGPEEQSTTPRAMASLSPAASLGTGRRPCVVHPAGRATCFNPEPIPTPDEVAAARPALVEGLTAAVTITAGDGYTCAARRDGGASCGGRGAFGQLGRGDWPDRAPHGTPVTGLAGVSEVASHDGETCARLRDGSVHCWGRVSHRDPRAPSFVTTPRLVQGAAPSKQVVAGVGDTCSLTRDGGVECWGDQYVLADARLKTPFEQPAGLTQENAPGWLAEPQPLPLSSVVALSSDTGPCALTRTGAVHCFGAIRSDDARPRADQPLAGLEPAQRMWGGVDGGCIETPLGALSCFGNPRWRSPCQRADPPPSAWDPKLALGKITAMALSPSLGCALRPGGRGLRCWGEAHVIEGLGGSAKNPKCDRPLAVDLASPVALTAVAVGERHGCALDVQGGVWCAGDDRRGQLGRGTPKTSPPSAAKLERVGDLEPVASIAAGGAFTCAIGKSGKAWCWGDNSYGQLGNGKSGAGRVADDPKDLSSEDSARPVEVAGLAAPVALSLGSSHGCALGQAGQIWCWGNNDDGQVGTGGRERTYLPRPVEVVELRGPAP